MTDLWRVGSGGLYLGEMNPRGWSQGIPYLNYPLYRGLEEKGPKVNGHLPPLCASKPLVGLPQRIVKRTKQFDAIITSLHGVHGSDWCKAFLDTLMNEKEVDESWPGRLIWAAAQRDDMIQFMEPWRKVGLELAKILPKAKYPSREAAGYRAPFIDVALGSSLGFFCFLDLDWDTQFSAAVVTSIAYWTDMASGGDAPQGDLAKIFDVLPSLARACATGQADNLSPMKVLAMEYLLVQKVQSHTGPPPTLRDIWMIAFSDNRSHDDTRCSMAWAICHDLYDLPRDLSSGNMVNAAIWALFSGYSARAIVNWLRESLVIGTGRNSTSCATKSLLATAFVHACNPRWAINGLASTHCHDWPRAPLPSTPRKDILQLSGADMSGFDHQGTSPCECRPTDASNTLARAVQDVLTGSVERFTSAEERLQAHCMGMSALVKHDWDMLIKISRKAWSTFLQDLDAIADWVDGKCA
ncbi:uncharacterized protein FIESC28_10918 [Fusarium coffeatum]|uniref:Uncharacterized protein n=1 Tax=Fusarium coffeatum TaxID=231269 RepID=A0A366QPZ9_9HYPO|nr:uncharacterized protein FIESC28_10918 [Fusarium coffeatum]RBR06802.1 hypothetical protein FIESC28_10918 [Fusarium coffeatum]